LDNQAGLQRLKTLSDNPGQDYQIRTIRAAQQIVEKGATVTLEWVLGHTDIQGNKEADKLAKASTKEPSSSPEKTSFVLLGLKIRQIGTIKWKEAIQLYKNKNKSNLNLHLYTRLYSWNISSKL
jgi:hypothetical protein